MFIQVYNVGVTWFNFKNTSRFLPEIVKQVGLSTHDCLASNCPILISTAYLDSKLRNKIRSIASEHPENNNDSLLVTVIMRLLSENMKLISVKVYQ